MEHPSRAVVRKGEFFSPHPGVFHKVLGQANSRIRSRDEIQRDCRLASRDFRRSGGQDFSYPRRSEKESFAIAMNLEWREAEISAIFRRRKYLHRWRAFSRMTRLLVSAFRSVVTGLAELTALFAVTVEDIDRQIPPDAQDGAVRMLF